MAASPLIIVRFARNQWEQLSALLFSRYPQHEWASWLRFGWRRTSNALVFTLAGIDPPLAGDLDERVGNVAIQEPYSLRIALASEQHPFAVGLVHSHPHEYLPIASAIDDEMDEYYADYLQGFAPERPYLSLIVSKVDGDFAVSGRVWHEGSWTPVSRFALQGQRLPTWVGTRQAAHVPLREERVARLAAGFGRRAGQRIRNATIAVVGASGTGSPAIEVLARAGVGHLIVVDPDTIDDSNLERVHGSSPLHVAALMTKVAIARDHVAAIDTDIRFEGIVGRVPQDEVVDALARADVILSCTDQQHARLALSEMACRYLVPVIDSGVSLEGAEGIVTGQTIQLMQFGPDLPCAACRGMVNWQRIGQELMSADERRSRQAAAREALARGEDPGGYWKDVPQLNTVGYLTTAAGALAAGAAIGIVTGAFKPGFTRLQLNPLSEPVDVLDWPQSRRAECWCAGLIGFATLSADRQFITPARHWRPVARL